MGKDLNRLLAEVLRIAPENITDDLAMKDVASWDSLTHMELIVALEQTFSMQLAFDDIVAMQSVREIKRVLKAKGIGV